jgi:hypothetical protein
VGLSHILDSEGDFASGLFGFCPICPICRGEISTRGTRENVNWRGFQLLVQDQQFISQVCRTYATGAQEGLIPIVQTEHQAV